MPEYDGWQVIGMPIGKGGQGTVYAARSPKRVHELAEIADGVRELLRQVITNTESQKWISGGRQRCEDLARRIVEFGTDDAAKHAGSPGVIVMPGQVSPGTVSDREVFSVYVCDQCGHAELFGRTM